MFAGRETMNDGIFLLLGSNQGEPETNLAEALKRIEKFIGPIRRQSAVYRSAAWGMKDQPDFSNQVLEIATPDSPECLLEMLLDIERQMGRTRKMKWGPRVIDIDLLFYGNEVRNGPVLTLPHPGISERRFVLMPLAEIAPEFIHPVQKKSVKTLLVECTDPLWVERVG